jgi:glycosyltransferase involved in cell wall biosynthesis
MNVCHVITGLGTGGAEIMLQKLIAATAGNGMTHSVVSLTDRGPIGDALHARGIRIDSLGMRRGAPDVRAVVSLRRLLIERAPRVVQTWMYHSNLLGGLAARLAGIRAIVWNIRSSRLEPATEKTSTIWLAKLSGLLAHQLCGRIVTNSDDARRVHERMGYPSSLFEVIPNGFDLGTFKPDEAARASVRTELALAPETVLIGMISRFHPGKGHGTFLRAAARLASRRPDVHFLLAGDGVTSDDRALSRLVERAELRSRVSLLGRRTDTPRLFAALDLSTLTSLYESFPNVVGEAMACAVPCIVTDVGDAATIVGDTGAVVPVRDEDALVSAWSSLLDLGPAARRSLGARARARIAERYSLESVAARYVRLYVSVAGE